MSGIVQPSPETPSPFAMSGQSLAISARSTSRLKLFLKFYADSGNITQAAQAAGIERATHYRKLRDDPHYRAAFDFAKRHVGEDLEAEAIRLAKDGNAQIMITLLKRFLPEEYVHSSDVEVNISLSERIEAGARRVIEMQHDDSNVA